MNTDERCPRCDARMKTWHELEEEEREVVKRLPASAEYDSTQRESRHRWCTRCWFETSQAEEELA